MSVYYSDSLYLRIFPDSFQLVHECFNVLVNIEPFYICLDIAYDLSFGGSLSFCRDSGHCAFLNSVNGFNSDFSEFEKSFI